MAVRLERSAFDTTIRVFNIDVVMASRARQHGTVVLTVEDWDQVPALLLTGR
jgi:hypothetical protein